DPRSGAREADMSARRPSAQTVQTVRKGPGSDRTKWSICNTDYRRYSFRSHLLTAWAHGDAMLHTGRRVQAERPGTAPLSSELWHHTAYPAHRSRKPLGLNP